MLLVAILIGGILLLFVNTLISRPRHRYSHYEPYHNTPPGYMTHEQYAYDLRLRNQMAAFVNTLIFATVLLLVFIYISDRKEGTDALLNVDPVEHIYQNNEDILTHEEMTTY